MEVNLHDHLLAAQKWVADELARSKRDWLLAVGHFVDIAVYGGRQMVDLSFGHWR